MASGIDLIKAERQRQIEAEGYKPEHDDEHIANELSRAAEYYVTNGKTPWPWTSPRGTLSDERSNHIKAGALFMAEVARRERMHARTGSPAGSRNEGLIQYFRGEVENCAEWLDMDAAHQKDINPR